MSTALHNIDDVFIEMVQDLIAPENRLAIAIVAEEHDPVIITKSVMVVGSMEIILPGCWDATVMAGDFEGLVVDRRGMLEDVIVLCDALNLNYVVEH